MCEGISSCQLYKQNSMFWFGDHMIVHSKLQKQTFEEGKKKTLLKKPVAEKKNQQMF